MSLESRLISCRIFQHHPMVFRGGVFVVMAITERIVPSRYTRVLLAGTKEDIDIIDVRFSNLRDFPETSKFFHS